MGSSDSTSVSVPEEVELSALAVVASMPLFLLAEKDDEGISWSDGWGKVGGHSVGVEGSCCVGWADGIELGFMLSSVSGSASLCADACDDYVLQYQVIIKRRSTHITIVLDRYCDGGCVHKVVERFMCISDTTNVRDVQRLVILEF